jgi:hypothetical protein
VGVGSEIQENIFLEGSWEQVPRGLVIL